MTRPNITAAQEFVAAMLNTKLVDLGVDKKNQEDMGYAGIARIPDLERNGQWIPSEIVEAEHRAMPYDDKDFTLRQWINLLGKWKLGDLFADEAHRRTIENNPLTHAHYAKWIARKDRGESHELDVKRPLSTHLDFIRAMEDFISSAKKPSADTFRNEIKLLNAMSEKFLDKAVEMQAHIRADILEDEDAVRKATLLTFQLTCYGDPLPDYVQGDTRTALEQLLATYKHQDSEGTDTTLTTREIRETLIPLISVHEATTSQDYRETAEMFEQLDSGQQMNSSLCLHLTRQIETLADMLQLNLSRGRKKDDK